MDTDQDFKVFHAATKWLKKTWWGLAVANMVAFVGIYLLLWQFAEPLGIPETLETSPDFMKSRAFLHVWLSLVLGAYLTLLLDLKLRKDRWNEHGESNFFVKSYPRSQNPMFFSEIEKLVPTSKRIFLVGAGINLIWEEHILETIINRVKAGEAEVTICMGNPFSPQLQNRYIEEEMRNRHPSVGREGMMKNVRSLVHKIERAGNPEGLSFRLFEHYPTLATLIFDDNIYVYPYAYHVLGNVCPIFHFTFDGSETARFLVDNAERIVRYSVPATDVVNVREDRRSFSEKWIAAAVYIIPENTTPFYEWGSKIIGYDIWNDNLVDIENEVIPDVRRFVGEAKIYGFHATVADALFFSTQSSIDRLEAELKFLAEELKPFSISNFRIVDAFRGPKTIAMLCEDKSGTLEVLHHELVTRVYKTAISSNYLAGKTSNMDSNSAGPRDLLMLDRYGAPYILNSFQPHFTLCSNIPADYSRRQEVLRSLKESFEAFCGQGHLRVREVCLVVKHNNEQRWRILRRFPLSRR